MTERAFSTLISVFVARGRTGYIARRWGFNMTTVRCWRYGINLPMSETLRESIALDLWENG